MTNHRRLQKAELIERQEKQKKVNKKALHLCGMIMPLIDPTLSEVVDMDIETASNAMDDLVVSYAELRTLNDKVKQLEEALYG